MVTAAVLTAGAVEVKQKVATDPINDGANTPAKIAAVAPPGVKPVPADETRTTEPVEVARVEKTDVEAPPAVTEPVPEPTTPSATEPETAAPLPTDGEPHTAAPAHETDDGLVGTVEDVPYQPEPSTDPAVAQPSDPVISPQVPATPVTPPPTAEPTTPQPSTPAPAAPQAPTPQE